MRNVVVVTAWTTLFLVAVGEAIVFILLSAYYGWLLSLTALFLHVNNLAVYRKVNKLNKYVLLANSNIFSQQALISEALSANATASQQNTLAIRKLNEGLRIIREAITRPVGKRKEILH
jgi:cellulose synthase/poly-beta-1,6-N-acetylglucosamine synthase-like glycosyltransferase